VLSPDVLDVAILERLRALQAEGEPDVVEDVSRVFLEDAPDRLKNIRASVESGDPVVAERLAHSLKSSASMLGARTLSRVASQVESRAREKSLPAGDPLLAELETAFAEAREALGLLGLDPADRG
jgi:HPt (histidine-containing phosphotransfer) domain-containing protein